VSSKTGPVLQESLARPKSQDMVTAKAAHCSKSDSTEDESMCTKLMKHLEAFEETKLLRDSGMCLETTPYELGARLMMRLQELLEQHIHVFR
jgi:hypothetical protein